ncbi:hypothetical protein PFISCL1PPCAC_8984, partial [Pristionchus fissidentatus]
RTIKCKSLEVIFCGLEDLSPNFMQALIANRDLTRSSISIQWEQPHQAPWLKNLLAEISLMDELHIVYPDKNAPNDEPLLDDAALLHIAKHTNRLELTMRRVQFSGQGILNAAEAQINKDIRTGLKLEVSHSTIDELQNLMYADPSRFTEDPYCLSRRDCLRM